MSTKGFATFCLWALLQLSASPPSNAYSVLQSSSNNPFAQTNDQFSVCFYINLKSSTPVDQQVPLLAYLVGDNPEIVVQLEYARQASALYIGGSNGVFFSNLPSANEWTHICLTCNGDAGVIKAYKNGQSTGLAQGIQQGYSIPSDGSWSLTSSLGDFGQVTKLQVWDRVITIDEVQQAASCSGYGNILSWDADYVSNPCIPTCSDHPTTSDLDIYDFDDYSHYEYPHIVEGIFEKPLGKQKDFSVCAWVYVERDAYLYPIEVEDEDGDYPFLLGFNRDGSIEIDLGSDYEYLDDVDIDYYDWQHICVVRKMQTGRLEFYINGNLEHVLDDFATGYAMSPGGELQVYQLQYGNVDEDDDDYSLENFGFKTTDVNWWDYALYKEEVEQVYSCSGSLPGNVLSWDNDEFYYYDDWIRCKEPDESSFLDYVGYVPELEYIAYEAEEPLPELKELSICTWWILLENSDYLGCVGLVDQEPFAARSGGDFGIYFCPNDYIGSSDIPGYYFECGIVSSFWYSQVEGPVGEWQHVCYTWKGDSGDTQLYINGELAAEGNNGGNDSIGEGEWRLYPIRYESHDEEKPYRGAGTKITDFNLWSYIITEDEVEDAYCGNAYGDLINEDTEWAEAEPDYSPWHEKI